MSVPAPIHAAGYRLTCLCILTVTRHARRDYAFQYANGVLYIDTNCGRSKGKGKRVFV